MEGSGGLVYTVMNVRYSNGKIKKSTLMGECYTDDT